MEKEKREKESRDPLQKYNNPHLTGGEQQMSQRAQSKQEVASNSEHRLDADTSQECNKTKSQNHKELTSNIPHARQTFKRYDSKNGYYYDLTQKLSSVNRHTFSVLPKVCNTVVKHTSLL